MSSAPAATMAATAPRPSRWRRRIVEAARRSLYAAAALPVGLFALIGTPFGGARGADRLQRKLAHRLLREPVPAEDEAGSSRRRTLYYGLASLPANLVAFVLVMPVWTVFLARGVFYPVFGADTLDQSWGGPTLAGAWFVHFVTGLLSILAVTILVWPVSRYQARQARKHLGALPE